jgi:hypothetical protein
LGIEWSVLTSLLPKLEEEVDVSGPSGEAPSVEWKLRRRGLHNWVRAAIPERYRAIPAGQFPPTAERGHLG